MRIKLRHQPHTVLPNEPRRVVTVLVIFKSMIDRQPGHPDINARLARIPFRIQPQDRRLAQRAIGKQNHVNAVMKLPRGRSQPAFSSRLKHHRFKSFAISANGANGMSDIEGSEPDWRSCEGSSE